MTKRIKRTTPPGNWRPVPGYEGKYLVSDRGELWSIRYNRYLSQRPDPNGYAMVNLSNKRARVHRIVARAFVEGNGPLVRHLDGDPSNNHCSNLAWGTAAENAQDTKRHGISVGPPRKTHCMRGHEFTPENVYRSPSSRSRACKACKYGGVYPLNRKAST